MRRKEVPKNPKELQIDRQQEKQTDRKTGPARPKEIHFNNPIN